MSRYSYLHTLIFFIVLLSHNSALGSWEAHASARLNQFSTATTEDVYSSGACFGFAEAEVIFDDLSQNRSSMAHATPMSASAFTEARREPTGGNPGGVSFADSSFSGLELSIINDENLDAIADASGIATIQANFLVEWDTRIEFTTTGIFVTAQSGGNMRVGVSTGSGYTTETGAVAMNLSINGTVDVTTSGFLEGDSNVGSKIVSVQFTIDTSGTSPVSLYLLGDTSMNSFSMNSASRSQFTVTPLPLATLSTTDGTALELLDVHYAFVETGLGDCDDDGDGLHNDWETYGYDRNGDGTIDIDFPGLGADPLRADIFIEVDAMTGRAPQQDLDGNLIPDALEDVIQAFADSPRINPDTTTGITLHIEVDETDIPLAQWGDAPFGEFLAVKNQYFGTPSQRSDPNSDAILAAKKATYRYSVFADTWGSNNSSGKGEIWGNDFMVTLGAANTAANEAGTFMHELGHTLGLTHGGQIFGQNFKPNYFSVMNYLWQLPNSALNDSMGNVTRRLDYSREKLDSLNENNLDEVAGIGPNSHAFSTTGVAYPRAPTWTNDCQVFLSIPTSGPIDWDLDGAFNDHVQVELNSGGDIQPCRFTTLDNLKGFDDWSAIKINFRGSPFYFLHGGTASAFDEEEAELSYDQHVRISESFVTAYDRFDLNGDGSVDEADLGLALDAFGTDVIFSDFNLDGTTDTSDVRLLIEAWD